MPIESISKGSRSSILNATAPSAVLVHQGAVRVGVQCHCVLRLVVDAFDDVDFAIVGPLVMLWVRISHADSSNGGCGLENKGQRKQVEK